MYTRARLGLLEEASRSGDPVELDERKAWTTVAVWQEQAQREGTSILVLLSGADATNDVAYVATLARLASSGHGSRCRLENIRKLANPFPLENLHRASDGGPLSSGDPRSYRLCRTPPHLLESPPQRDQADYLPLERPRPAFLLLWNPDRYPWDELQEIAEACRIGKTPWQRWMCRSNHVRPADRVFWMRTHTEPRGIFAVGTALGIRYFDEHFEAPRTQAPYVSCRIEHALHPDRDAILSLDALQYGPFRRLHWPPRASGHQIPEDAALELECLWETHIQGAPGLAAEPEALEGERRLTLRAHYNREQGLRAAKIRAVIADGRRLVCEVPGCGFDFERVYGAIGSGYCQVHHKQQLSRRRSATTTRLADLAVVCANCHAIIHRNGECREIETLVIRARR